MKKNELIMIQDRFRIQLSSLRITQQDAKDLGLSLSSVDRAISLLSESIELINVQLKYKDD